MMSVFIGISLLAPDEPKGGETKDNSTLASITSSSTPTDTDRLITPSEDAQTQDPRSRMQAMLMKATEAIVKAKAACSLSLGFGEDSINASAGLVMPMVSSKITGFRGSSPDGGRLFSLKNPGWTKISMDEDGAKMLDTSSSMLS
ncbi:putative magnesium transporter NIPA8 [Vitis vinifera]|nr:putative magnesium transporter NIPA8 [Vitis vinifera]